MGGTLLGKKTNYTAPLNVLNDLAQDKVCTDNSSLLQVIIASLSMNSRLSKGLQLWYIPIA